MPSITKPDETRHVRRWRRHERSTAPQAHGGLCVPAAHGGADAGARLRDGRWLRPRGLDLPAGGRSPRPPGSMSRPMTKTASPNRNPHALDRRAVISGRLVDPDRAAAPAGGEIASILVQARPERLGAVEAAITALAGCEIHGRDPMGKLAVVIDAPDAGLIGTTLNVIALLPDVYAASLVYHAIDLG